jgi:diketogulonate reductase-like aldo/keto reductase
MHAGGPGKNRSTVAAYSKENLDVFDFSLSDDEVAALNNMQLP